MAVSEPARVLKKYVSEKEEDNTSKVQQFVGKSRVYQIQPPQDN